MRFASAFVLALLLGACSSSSTSSGAAIDAAAPPGDGPPGADAGAGADSGEAGVPAFPDDHGPGIYGALPSGYCCTKDAECKDRHCADPGGGKRCMDSCLDTSFCNVPGTPYECKATTAEEPKRCTPPAGVQCLPQADFVRGKKKTGDCCVFGEGQTAGAECASHVCGNFGDGPDICMNHCVTQADCLDGYKCELSGGSSYVPTCLPLAVYSGGTYTCNP
jgi:hypothetical protein